MRPFGILARRISKRGLLAALVVSVLLIPVAGAAALEERSKGEPGARDGGALLINNRTVLSGLGRELKFGRKLWGFLCLELWQRAFHDRAAIYKDMLKGEEART